MKPEIDYLGSKKAPRHEPRTGSLFGVHPGSVAVAAGVDLTAPALDPAFERSALGLPEAE